MMWVWMLKRGLGRLRLGVGLLMLVFLFKQLTAYVVDVCEWRSVVCFSDLAVQTGTGARAVQTGTGARAVQVRYGS